MTSFSTGQLEALKWLALVLMLGDHVNTALFARQLPLLSELGRLAFPIFALLLAYNMARPMVNLRRVFFRLLVVACIAQPFHAYAFPYGFLPLNVLFTFAAFVGALWAFQRRQWWLVLLAILIAPLFVDYQWPGVWLCGAGFQFFRRPGQGTALSVLAALLSLMLINGNQWALLALPVMWLATRIDLPFQRQPQAFYVLYPAHLAMLSMFVVLL